MSVLCRSLRIPAADAEQLGWATVAVVLCWWGSGCLDWWPVTAEASPFASYASPSSRLCALNASAGAFEVVFSAKSGRQIASQLRRCRAETEVACLECFPNGLPFYLSRTATLISRDGGEMTSNYIISTLERDVPVAAQIVPAGRT